MRSFGELPRSILVLEGLGIVLLILAYLSIHGYVQLPGALSSQAAAVAMIFLGVALMLPAAALLVWRVAHGFGPLMRGGLPPENDRRKPPQQQQQQKRDPRD